MLRGDDVNAIGVLDCCGNALDLIFELLGQDPVGAVGGVEEIPHLAGFGEAVIPAVVEGLLLPLEVGLLCDVGGRVCSGGGGGRDFLGFALGFALGLGLGFGFGLGLGFSCLVSAGVSARVSAGVSAGVSASASEGDIIRERARADDAFNAPFPFLLLFVTVNPRLLAPSSVILRPLNAPTATGVLLLVEALFGSAFSLADSLAFAAAVFALRGGVLGRKRLLVVFFLFPALVTLEDESVGADFAFKRGVFGRVIIWKTKQGVSIEGERERERERDSESGRVTKKIFKFQKLFLNSRVGWTLILAETSHYDGKVLSGHSSDLYCLVAEQPICSIQAFLELVQTLVGHNGPVECVTFSPSVTTKNEDLGC